MQHGSHGTAKDLRYFNILVEESDYMRSMIHRYSDVRRPVHLFFPLVNEGRKTDDGVRVCGERLAMAVRDEILERIPVNRGIRKVPLSFVGHSFGGLIIREAITYLAQDQEILDRVAMDSICTLACPHLGVRTMHPVLRAGGTLVGRLKSRTYKELFHDGDDTLSAYMLDADHMNALKAFRQRVFIGERSDRLVSLTSSTLYPAPSSGAEVPTKRLCEEFPSVAHPAVLTPNRFMLIKDRSKNATGAGVLTEEELMAMQTLSKLEPAGVHAYVVDFQQTAGRLKLLNWRVRAGVDLFSHRALVCKDPFHFPAAFGDVLRFVHDRVLGLRVQVPKTSHGFID